MVSVARKVSVVQRAGPEWEWGVGRGGAVRGQGGNRKESRGVDCSFTPHVERKADLVLRTVLGTGDTWSA